MPERTAGLDVIMVSFQRVKQGKKIVDSRMSFAEAVSGTAAPLEVLKQLCLLDVCYYAFDGKLHQGQLVANKRLRGEIEGIFAMIKDIRFPVARVVPIVHYGWSDATSMADNNTSAFNYRFVAGTARLSCHAAGEAIDINPRQNPVVYASGTTLPPGAVYVPPALGAFFRGCPALDEFLSRGWKWGGEFTSVKDYHHFEKPR